MSCNMNMSFVWICHWCFASKMTLTTKVIKTKWQRSLRVARHMRLFDFIFVLHINFVFDTDKITLMIEPSPHNQGLSWQKVKDLYKSRKLNISPTPHLPLLLDHEDDINKYLAQWNVAMAMWPHKELKKKKKKKRKFQFVKKSVKRKNV